VAPPPAASEKSSRKQILSYLSGKNAAS